MLRASPLVALALAVTALGAPRAALGHTLLVSPPPLITDDNAKSGPCGCYFGAGPEDATEDTTAAKCPAGYTTTELIAGSQITVSWKETVNHAGKFRIAFAPVPVDGVVKADLDANILYDEEDSNATAGTTLIAKVTVPTTPCASCTLQLRQLMTGATNPYYWSCAAIKIVPASGTGGDTTAAGAGGAGGDGQGGSSSSPAGAGGTESTAAGLAVPPVPLKTGACSASSASEDTSRFGAALLAAAAALSLRARRRAR